MKYRFLGKEKRLALGVYPEVGLQDARRKRDDARVQLASGQDPSLQRRMAKVVSQLDHQHTFESVAKQWLAIRESSWDPEYTRTVVRQRLELNAYPWLGKLPVNSINTPMLVENLLHRAAAAASSSFTSPPSCNVLSVIEVFQGFQVVGNAAMPREPRPAQCRYSQPGELDCHFKRQYLGK